MVSGVAPARAQGLRKGTVIVPPSNVVPPQYRGKRAHTNFLIFKPAKGGLVGPSPAGETPSSLACVYKVGSKTLDPTTSKNCPVVYGSSGDPAMNYDNPAGGSNIIAIVDAYDYPTALNDFNTFSQMFGLPNGNKCGDGTQPCFTKAYPGGSQPRSNSSWAQEEALDIEWAHAMAPNAQIVLVEAASNSNADLMQAVAYANTIVSTCNFTCGSGGTGEVSMSWGGSESSSEISYDSTYFTQSGITYFASSGDSGGKVIWPSSSPNVVSAGGTTVNRTKGNFTGETTWSSAGGGYSSYETMPSYQDITALINTTQMRGTPDISFDANPSTGVSVYDSTASQGLSGWLVFGGTSVSSPSLAGIVNNAGAFDGGWDGGNNTSSVQSNLYSNYATETGSTGPLSATNCSYNGSTTPFYDITSGSAGTYPSGPCWDFASGIGTLRGTTGLTGSGASSGSAPAAPTGLTATAGNGQVSLTWTGSSGATSYEVLRSTTSGSESPLTSVTSTSYTDTGLSNGTTYFYVVEAANTYGTSGASNEASATPTSTSSGSFQVTTTTSSFSVTRGGSASTITVTVTPSGGFTGDVTLSVTGLPNSVSGSFSTNPVPISGTTAETSTLTVTAGSHGPAKTYTLTITGTSGSLSNSTTVTLTVNK
jgi:kumamolisin